MEELFGKVYDTVRPATALIGACISYVMFPTESFVVWCTAVAKSYREGFA